MNARRSNVKRRGFTLVEVLASMAIFTIVIPIAMKSAVIAERAASHARHSAEAATLGEEALNEIVQSDWTQAPTQGSFAPDYPGYTFTLQNQQQDIGITALMLTVTWKEQGQDRSVNLSTFVYQATGTGDSGAASGAASGASAGGTP